MLRKIPLEADNGVRSKTQRRAVPAWATYSSKTRHFVGTRCGRRLSPIDLGWACAVAAVECARAITEAAGFTHPSLRVLGICGMFWNSSQEARREDGNTKLPGRVDLRLWDACVSECSCTQNRHGFLDYTNVAFDRLRPTLAKPTLAILV